MLKVFAVVAVATLVTTVVGDDVLDALSCYFNDRNFCKWQGEGWKFNCFKDPWYCYISTADGTSWDTLKSVTFNNSQPICFQVGYMFYLPSYSTLSVSISGREVFNSTTQAPSVGWHQANVTIPAGSGWPQQMFVAVSKKDSQETTLIDYLRANYGTC